MKTESEKQIQKSIVCTYLRYRRARRAWHKRKIPNKLFSSECMQHSIDDAFTIMNENWNCLQSLKRVLWFNDWS